MNNIEQWLLPERNVPQTKLDGQCIFIWLFDQPMDTGVKTSIAQAKI
jgi:hypothetical protein